MSKPEPLAFVPASGQGGRMSDSVAARSLSDFFGLWHLEREITHHDGRVDRFVGTAAWTKAEGGAVCAEAGILTLSHGVALRAERRYLWDPDLRVSFADGRFFHAVPSVGGEALHLCPPDTYGALYDFSAWPAWQCRWSVTGPKKAYIMRSAYARA
jgi:hypothetical protein